MSIQDYRLYLVTDRDLCRGRHLLEVIKEAVRGGVTVVQLREKDLPCRKFVDIAREVKIFLVQNNVPLIINDRADVALAIEADGIHVGQEDMHVRDVRKLVGPEMTIGLSVNTVAQAQEANHLPIDYIGVGPLYPTRTKKDAKKPLFPEGFKVIRKISLHPVVAIGGISVGTAAEVMRAGAHGLAVVSDICAADSPQKQARTFIEVIEAQETNKTIYP
jgi:thiamine-phosphate pyrophosphorylase